MRRQVENLQSFEWPWLNKSTMLVKKAFSSLKLCGIVRPTAHPANRQPIGPSRKTQALFSQPATCLFVQRLTIFWDLSFCLALGHPACISLRKRVQPRDPQPQLDGSIIINAPSLMCQMGWQWRQTNKGGIVGGRAVRRAHKDWDRDRPKPISAEIFCRICNRIFCRNRIVANWHYEVGTILQLAEYLAFHRIFVFGR